MFQRYPLAMSHPHHQPAVISRDTVNRDGSITHAAPGRPEKFPPVFVNNQDQEEYYASLGYVPNGTPDPEAYKRAVINADEPSGHKHVEYPKYLYQYSECADEVMDVLVHSEAEEKNLKGDWHPTPGAAMAAVEEPEEEKPAAAKPAGAGKSTVKKSTAKKPAAKGKSTKAKPAAKQEPEQAEGADAPPAEPGKDEA